MTVLDLSCKAEDPPVEPEVRVDIKTEEASADWVRIPVTAVEQWINKDGPAHVNRTAKVTFPATWTLDGEERDIASVMNGFQAFQQGEGASAGNPYDQARIFFYDRDLDEYRVTHHGYVGGVGPANPSQTGEMKCWIYDPADLLRSIQVSKTWDSPSVRQLAAFAIDGTDSRGEPVGIRQRTIFDQTGLYVAGFQDIPFEKGESVVDITDQDIEAAIKIEDEDFRIDADIPYVGSVGINVGNVIEDVLEAGIGFARDHVVDSDAYKQFRLNRHNMVDHLNWLTNLIDARWWFEPTPERPVLFIDATGQAERVRGNRSTADIHMRRLFEAEEVGDELEVGLATADAVSAGPSNTIGQGSFATVDLLDNSALYDIKPFNTMTVYGESARSREAPPENYASTYESGSAFPYVELRYPPLIKRAGNNQYSAPVKETDDLTLRQAIATAKEEFRAHLAENTEGNIIMKGEPHILPGDILSAVPVCRDIYTIDTGPIDYEVNEVKHERSGGSHYTTTCGVSLSIDETKFEFTAELREA